MKVRKFIKEEKIAKGEEKKMIKSKNDTLIKPIVFTTKGNCTNKGLVDYPFSFAKETNNYIFKNYMLNNVDPDTLYSFRFLAGRCSNAQFKSYLYSLLITNVMSALYCSDYTELFNELGVYRDLVNELPKMLDSLFVGSNAINVFRIDGHSNILFSNDDLSRLINECKIRAKLVTEFLVTITFSIVDSSINRIYNCNSQIIDNLINTIDNDVLIKLTNESPKDKYTLCTILIKEIARDLLSNVMNKSICPAVEELFIKHITTGYHIYYDAYKKAFDEEE